ncbi:hypothetical protein Tco_1342939 [Tanacetum coccineum]
MIVHRTRGAKREANIILAQTYDDRKFYFQLFEKNEDLYDSKTFKKSMSTSLLCSGFVHSLNFVDKALLNNEILMKNHQSRPTGSLAYPEVNATKNDTKSFMRGQGQSHGKGRGQFGKNNSHGHNRSFDQNRKKAEFILMVVDSPVNNDGSCFRRGISNHRAKSCRTAPQLCELYQSSLKEKERESEANLVDQVDFRNNWIPQTSSVVTPN